MPSPVSRRRAATTPPPSPWSWPSPSAGTRWPRARPLRLGTAPPVWRRWRRNVARWLVALLLAAVAAANVQATLDRADRAAVGLGSRRAVTVARHLLDAGRTIGAADVERREIPVGDLPAEVADEPVIGRVVTADIGAGEVLTRRRLAPDGLHGLAALVPPGRRAVAIPVAADGLAPLVGDHVDIIGGEGGDPMVERSNQGLVTARDALVIGVAEGAVTVAVTEDELAGTAAALGRGTPVLALVGRP